MSKDIFSPGRLIVLGLIAVALGMGAAKCGDPATGDNNPRPPTPCSTESGNLDCPLKKAGLGESAPPEVVGQLSEVTPAPTSPTPRPTANPSNPSEGWGPIPSQKPLPPGGRCWNGRLTAICPPSPSPSPSNG